MAEAKPTTTRPSRARSTAAKTAPAKAAPAAAKAASAATPASEPTTVTRFKVELDHVGTTKQYEKFSAPDNLKGTVVGSIYAPIGTERIVVMIVGAGDAGDE